MALRDATNGRFDYDELCRMRYPIAWASTIPEDEAARQELEYHDMIDEARDALEEAYQLEERDDAKLVVRITAGAVVGVEDYV